MNVTFYFIKIVQEEFSMNFVAICEKEIILRKDEKPMTAGDFEKLKEKNPVAEYFEEKANELKVLALASADNLGEEYLRLTLREYFAGHSETENFLAFRSKALFNWHSETKFCGACGAKLIPHEKLTAMTCPDCGRIIFPRISPCVIVVVSKDDKVLLARHTYRNQNIYACIAGFMEAGESAEEAVRRELLEETGIKVKNLTYRGSQSWPFPDQLMLGFTAEYESGELKLQKEEIADAQWFDRNNCPASPKPGSIAYRLIHGEY